MRRVAASLVLACACVIEEEPDATGEHVDLFLHGDIEVCGGEVARTDAFIEHIHELWTGTPAGDLRFRFHAVSDVDGCGDGALGCVHGTTAVGFDHQIVQDYFTVQAIVRHLDGRSAEFFDAGLPLALAPYSALDVAASQLADVPTTLLSEDEPDVYEASGQAIIAAYLLGRYGGPAVREYYRALAPADQRTQDDFATEFDAVFGAPLDTAWADFQRESRCLTTYRFCDGGTAITLPFELSGFACSDPSTTGYSAPTLAADDELPYQPQQILLLDNEVARTIAVDVTAGSVYVIACGACPAAAWPTIGDPERFELDLEVGQYAFIASDREGDVVLEITAVP